MKRSRHSSSLVYALYVNAALLLGILVALLSRERSGAAFALPTDQAPIAGGGGVYVMPCQMHPAVWGCYVLDTNRQTLCAYEYRAGDKALILTAARNYRYDLDLKNFNTFPAWYDIQKAVEDAAKNEQMNESKLPSVTPAVPKEDNPQETTAMAKMFYTLDETKAALGKNEEDIKQMSREGRLREFRDGPRLMFKADQVEALKVELQGGGGNLENPDLGPSDSGMAIGLADSKGASGALDAGSGISGSGLTLSEADPGHSPGAGMSIKEDTALAADLGLSGSIGGVPSPARSSGGSGTGLSGSQGSRPGVDVFQNDDVDRVDPSAQTAISAAHEIGGADSVGSGSGLLDLTRESDDTSLGAELLDEIAPGGTGAARRPPGETAAGASATGVVEIRGIGGGAAAARGPAAGGGGVIYEEKADPMAPAFGAAALGAALIVLFGAYALISGMLDSVPAPLNDSINKFGFLGVAGGGLAVVLIFFVVGLIVGKSAPR